MIKQKKILLITILFFVFFLIIIKFIDLFLQKKIGLGNPLIYESSKIYGYTIKPNQNIYRLGNKITINNLGMRSSYNWDVNTKKKIIFIGDSVTYGGSIVSNEDLFSDKVCKEFNKKNSNYICGNMGVNGYNLYSLIRNIKYKNFDKESFIVITIIANNFPRMFHNVISQPFWSKEIDNFLPALTEIFFIIVDKYRNKIKYKLGEEKILRKLDVKYYNDLAEELKNVLSKKEFPYIVLYSPSKMELKREENNEIFKNILKNKFENFYDLSEIKYKKKEEFYHDNIHLNKQGHHVYSKYIYSIIRNLY
jgi:lysophospholipase L1-like esterase